MADIAPYATTAVASSVVFAADRQAPLDIVKGVGILLVVYGHLSREIIDQGMAANPAVLEVIYFCIYTFHMPLFFVIAGYNAQRSIKKHGSREFLWSRAWKVIYPYFLWSFLIWFPKCVLADMLAIKHPFSLSDIVTIAWRPISIYWFLFALLVWQLACVACRRSAVELLVFAVAFDAVVLFVGVNREHIVNIVASVGPFVALGALAAERNVLLANAGMASPITEAAASIVFLVGCYVGFNQHVTSNAGLITLPISIAGIVLTLTFARAIPTTQMRNHFAFLGRHSLSIYILHIFILSVILLASKHLHIRSDVIVLVGGTLFSAYASILAALVARRMGLETWLGLSGKPLFRLGNGSARDNGKSSGETPALES